jgi:nitroreductase
MNREDVLNFIMSRRSIRSYTSEAVSQEELTVILKAAMAAPSASNKKPWAFVVAREKDVLKSLSEAHPYGKMIKDAALAIAIVGKPKVSDWWVQDCSAATENILLAVSGLGLGAVWLGVYPREDRNKAVKEVLGLPEGMEVLSLIPIGHPAQEASPRTQYEEEMVHYNKW